MLHTWSPARAGGALALVAALALGLLGALPANAAECPAPGGADEPFDADPAKIAPEADLAVAGGGWGHGVGMSQYGAQGAAELGCTHDQILSTYYPGATVQAQPMPDVVRVGLLDPRSQTEGGATVSVLAESGPLTWHLHSCGDPAAPTDCGVQPPQQPQGATWRVRAVRDADPARDGRFVITDQNGTELWTGGDKWALLDAPHDGTVLTIEVPGLKRRSRWGVTRLDSLANGDGHLFAVEHITSGGGFGAMERYLWGLAEVPSSWPAETLKTQVVAARSYAVKRIGLSSRYDVCRCDLYATTADQHWTGWQHEHDDEVGAGGAWKTAVNETAGRVVRHDGAIVDAFYSSSHGGWSDASKDVWGADVAYLQAIDTSNWEAASDNPRQRWTGSYTAEQLAQRFGLATFGSITIQERGTGGRPTRRDANGDGEPDGVLVTGTDEAGGPVERWYSGEELRSKLGTYSALVHLEDVSDVQAARLRDPDKRDRIGTSVAIARRGWESAGTVVIARANEPADALAGASLAGSLDAPLLITWPDALEPAIAAEVQRLGATTAILLGGEKALSPAVEQGLRDQGVEDVQRVSGPTRVETAAAIADRLQPEPGGSAYLVFSEPDNPRSWPDALAVSGPAARLAGAGTPRPVLITGRSVPESTWGALERLGIGEVVLAGGPAVIPTSVEDELEAAGYAHRRVAGADRYETSRAVAGDVPAPAGTLLVATGDNYPDGLSAGALAGRLDVTLILVPGPALDAGSREWVAALDWPEPSLLVAGGPAAVSDTAFGELRTALQPPDQE